MLMSAGVDLPKGWAIGGWLLSDGSKMSKTSGNVVDPLDLPHGLEVLVERDRVERDALGLGADGGFPVLDADGCSDCGGSGFKGRYALFEILEMTEPIRDLLGKGASSDAIYAEAKKQGMTTLFEQGIAALGAAGAVLAWDQETKMPPKGQTTRGRALAVLAGFGLLIVANGALNGVGRASLALAQSAARVFLIMLPFGWVLRASWGAEAIYGAELVANLAGGTLAALIVWRVLRSGPDDGGTDPTNR